MASVHRHDRSPYWYGSYPVGNGKWVLRSTKLTDRKKAEALVESYHATTRGTLTMIQAQKQISEIYANMNTGEKLPSSTIGGYLDKFLEQKKAEVSSSTLDAYEATFRFFKQFLGPRAGLDIKLLTRDDVVKFRQDRMNKTSPATARQTIKKLNVAIHEAQMEGLIMSHVGDGLTRIKFDPMAVKTREFTPGEIRKIDQAIDDPEWKGMFAFGLYTGQRIKDVAKAEWANVNFKEGFIRLFISKKKVEQKKFLAPPLKANLELMKKKATTPYLFPKAFEMVAKKDRSAVLSNQFAVFLVKAGILDKAHTSHKKKAQGRSAKRTRSGVGFHSLRHGATSLLKKIGVPHAVAMEIVGHDSKQVSQHYTHIGDDAIRDALKNFPDLLGKAGRKAKK